MKSKIPAFTPERALLDYLKDSNGGGFQKYKVTQGYLKILVLLGTTDSLTFFMMKDDGAGVAGDLRLNRSDAFWANIFAFFIGKVASGGSVAAIVERTFANPYVFTNAAELAALHTLYNGNIKIEISDELYFQQLDLKRFKYVGIAQEGLAASTAVTGLYAEGDWNPMTGFYESCPNLLISGQSTPKAEISLPASVAMGGTAGSTNYGILYFRGFYIPDGAKLGGEKD